MLLTIFDVYKLIYIYSFVLFFRYVISDGTFRKEDGGLINNKGALNLVVRGEYGYIDPEGHHHYIKYIADTNGFQALSDYNDVRFNDRRIV